MRENGTRLGFYQALGLPKLGRDLCPIRSKFVMKRTFLAAIPYNCLSFSSIDAGLVTYSAPFFGSLAC